jgi:hypothetical protein
MDAEMGSKEGRSVVQIKNLNLGTTHSGPLPSPRAVPLSLNKLCYLKK